MRNHRQIAMHLEHTDLPVTYLAANIYMEDLLSAADTVREQGAVLAPAGDGRVGWLLEVRAAFLGRPSDLPPQRY